MLVINPCSTLLTNYEVFTVLMNLKNCQTQDDTRMQKSFQHHNTIVFETIKYFNKTVSTIHSKKQILNCMKALAKYKLTAIELKQVINLCPTQPVDVQLIVEECEERFSEEQVEEIIKVVNENLPIPRNNKLTISNGMHLLVVIKDTIRIPFHQMSKDFKPTLIEKIDKQYSNYVINDVGLCITFYNFESIGASFLLPGESFTCTPVTFRYIVFHPLINEIFVGTILRSNREGIIVSMEFCNDIFIEPDKLPSVSKFDETEQNWYWEYNADGDMAKLYMEPGHQVRCRVLNVQYINIEPGITSDTISAIKIKASMAEVGLGCLSWWENAEQQSEDIKSEDDIIVTEETK